MKDLKGTPLVFRVDADSEMGTGHLMRCLALAQAWKDNGGSVVFITGCQNEKLLKRLDNEGFLVHKLGKQYPDGGDWTSTREFLARYSGAWVVLDGYHFDENYQKQIKETGHSLLVIDDTAHLKHYYADIILNQNINSEKFLYSCEPYTRLLTGTKYVLLRREFAKLKNHKHKISKLARRVLVTIGGGDPDNNTLKVVQAFQDISLPGLEVKIVIGASNLHAKALEAAITSKNLAANLIYDAKNMPELMAWADVAISAGGTTSWELAFMGLPDIVGVTAENQRLIAQNLELSGLAVNLGWYSEIDSGTIVKTLLSLLQNEKVRMGMSRKGRHMVDGKGGQRVISIIVDPVR
jgi:UDP-2,4-diacetamido-2,4,6-trideoxy-beta-L-altropyranose hydrolase